MSLRMTAPFLHSASALSLVWRGRDLVNSTRSFSRSSAMSWLTYSDPQVRVKAANGEREALEQQRDHGQQKGFADALHRGYQLPLGDDIHGVDMVEALDAVLIALVHGIDADIAR